MPSNVRLGCLYCDRSDFDGVDTIPSDWTDVHEVRSLEESCRPVEPHDRGRSVFDWETHLGVCPECQHMAL